MQEKLIKVKGKLSLRVQLNQIWICSAPWIFSLTFVSETFLSPYVMLAESGSVVIYEFEWCVLLFCVVAYYFYSRLVYSFTGLQEMLRPHESKCTSHCVTPPRLENKPYPMKYALWWPLMTSVRFSLGSLASGQGSQHIIVWFITKPSVLKWIWHNFIHEIMHFFRGEALNNDNLHLRNFLYISREDK